MKQITCAGLFRRLTASAVLLAYLASCTHMPSGQKAFDSFEQCIAGNLGLAAAGGVAVGALGKALARQVTGDRSTQNVVGVTAGAAAAVMIGLKAWRSCAAVYNTSEPIAQPDSVQPLPQTVQRRTPGLSMDRLEVRVEGSENDPPIPEFDFIYVAEDAAARDIRARFRHKVEIVRFKADDNDKLILADASGGTLHDSAGKSIPLESAMRMRRDHLHWVTIAEEGKDDYVEDVVIQQGMRAGYRHKLQIPPRAQLLLPLPVPMRYTVTVEVGAFKSARTVDFALLGATERPRKFAAAAADSGGDRPGGAILPASVPASPAPKAEAPKVAPAAAGARDRAPAVMPPTSTPAAAAPKVDAPKAAPAAAGGGDRAPAVTQPPSAAVAAPPKTEDSKPAPAASQRLAAPAAPAAPGGGDRAPAVMPPASLPAAPAASVQEQKAAPTPAASFVATHTLRRDTVIHDGASSASNSVGRLSKDAPVRIEEPAGFNVTNKPQVWVKVVTRTGATGWLQAGELEETR